MKKILLLFALILLVGCSSTRIPVKNDFWGNQNKKIGIIFSESPEPNAYKAGSQGLLDMAINEAMSSNLETHLKTIKTDQFSGIGNIFKENFAKKGINDVVVIEDTIKFDDLYYYTRNVGKKPVKKSFSSLKDKYDVDFLVVFSINRYGTLRNYYSFIPLGAPQALFQVNGMMVNLLTNEYEWYLEMDEKESTLKIDGEWDEEPDFPNLTEALYSAMDQSQSFLTSHFFSL